MQMYVTEKKYVQITCKKSYIYGSVCYIPKIHISNEDLSFPLHDS